MIDQIAASGYQLNCTTSELDAHLELRQQPEQKYRRFFLTCRKDLEAGRTPEVSPNGINIKLLASAIGEPLLLEKLVQAALKVGLKQVLAYFTQRDTEVLTMRECLFKLDREVLRENFSI